MVNIGERKEFKNIERTFFSITSPEVKGTTRFSKTISAARPSSRAADIFTIIEIDRMD